MIEKLILRVLFTSLLITAASADMGNCKSYLVDEKLPNIIESDMTLDASKIYGIDKKVIVQNGATLTIKPGTTLAGCSLFSFLVIAQDAKIDAKGTEKEPIVFTSQIDLLGFSSTNGVGEWGGVVIAGNAFTHYDNNKYEADESISFGSSDHLHDNESSGVLEYVVIKHTGYEVRKDRELNGLSLAGVGSGTTIRNIAIVGGKDDGIEIWGGSVTIDGLFVYNAMDDSVDVDLGYQGEIKNVLVVQNKIASENNHDSSVMEIGNDEDLIQTDARTATLPKISNFTGYVKGGGIYNKYDAGFKLDNIKLVSKKSKNNEMVYFRGKDSYTTGAKYLEGDVCLYNSSEKKAIDSFLAQENSKSPKKQYTPYNYFIKDHHDFGKGKFLALLKCKGVNERKVWKGGLESEKEISLGALETVKVATSK